MLRAIDVAMYFLSKDSDHTLFNKNLIPMNNRNFYEGNARLNKYLHLAQNLYLAKTGKKLFSDNLYAYDNGAVVPEVQENYSILLGRVRKPELPVEICDFLDRFFVAFQNATVEELVELSHEDPEWENKHRFYAKPDQMMNSLAYTDEYKEQYRDMLRVMERMNL